MAIVITTNNHKRFFRYGHEVPSEVLDQQFDYQEEETFDGYLEYKGNWYHLDQFMRTNGFPESIRSNWSGYAPDGFYSGVLIKLSDDQEWYQVGTYISVYGDPSSSQGEEDNDI